MGGEPPLRREDEGQDEGADRAREHWFARQLGEQWQSEGDGIYRFVAQTNPSEARPPSDVARSAESPDTAPDIVDDLIAELSGEVGDAVAPSRRLPGRDTDDAPSTQQPDRSRAAWRRR